MDELSPRFREVFLAVFEALVALAEVAREPAMHREFGDYSDYEFFVMRT